MDKEREAFDNWYGKKPKGWFEGAKYNTAWKTWQAAKAKAPAVPEGFVLVPVETLNEALSWANCASSESWSDAQREEIDKHYEVIEKSMLAAPQEQKFNLDEFLAMEQKLKSKGGIIKADLDRFIAYAEMVLEKAKALKEPK